MWKASLRLGKESLPVKLYSAVRDRDIHFHLLHAKDGVRVRERFVNPESEREVDTGQARAGYPVESGGWVVLSEKERDTLAPKASRDIEIMRCVDADALPLSAYARAYWLGPDGEAPDYYAWVESLGDRIALVQWVMRGHHHFGALQGRAGHLALIDLRSADEWVDPKTIEMPTGRALDKRELAMAEQLVNALYGEFDHASFRDEYRARVHELIEQKAAGKHLRRRAKEPVRAAPSSLSSALSASLRSLNKERKSA
jgi:DNA end-binding protein Ku